MPIDRIPTPPIRANVSNKQGKPSLAWSKWFERVFTQLNQFAGIGYLAAKLTFTGRATNGDASIVDGDSYNIASIERTAVGLYEGTIRRQTAYGAELLSSCTGVINHSIDATAATQAYQIHFTVTSNTTFEIRVYQLVQGAGTSIDLTPYDPTAANDSVTLSIISQLTTDLPKS